MNCNLVLLLVPVSYIIKHGKAIETREKELQSRLEMGVTSTKFKLDCNSLSLSLGIIINVIGLVREMKKIVLEHMNVLMKHFDAIFALQFSIKLHLATLNNSYNYFPWGHVPIMESL